MSDLEKLVCDLENERNDEAQIQILQRISEELISEYEIVIGDLTVEPLWVEAYYYDRYKFPDCNTHMSERQYGSDNFGYLYFHEKGHGGIDICLSMGNYYLSFLIKAALVNKRFCKQTEIYNEISELKLSDYVLKRKDRKNEYLRIIHTQRVNLLRPCFRDAKLATVPLDVLGVQNYDFGFAHKVLASIAVEYVREYINDNQGATKKEYKDKCCSVFGWCPDSIDKLCKELNIK